MRKILALFALLSLAPGARAEEPAGEPALSSHEKAAVRIRDLPPGIVQFRIQAPDHEPQTVSATVEKDVVTPVDVALRRER